MRKPDSKAVSSPDFVATIRRTCWRRQFRARFRHPLERLTSRDLSWDLKYFFGKPDVGCRPASSVRDAGESRER